MRKVRLLAVAACGLCLLGAADASAATLAVDDDGMATPSNCDAPTPTYPKIQAAVTAAAPGDTIVVCPGHYPEQVAIQGPAKNDLTLVSVVRHQAFIEPPPVMVPGDDASHALVRIEDARGVRLLRFTITGPHPQLDKGVVVRKNASAAIIDNHVTHIRFEPLSGVQTGVAIQVGSFTGGSTPGRAVIAYNRVDDYQKNGITVNEQGSNGEVIGNYVQGAGPIPETAQNGIQFGFGAVGRASGNVVLDNAYSLAFRGLFSAAGILLYQPGDGVVVDHNFVQRNDTNLDAETTQRAKVSENRFFDSTIYDGIFFASDTAKNRIEDNVALRNKEHDCHDDSTGHGTAGTANFWEDNTGQTQNRPGLCRAHKERQGESSVSSKRARKLHAHKARAERK